MQGIGVSMSLVVPKDLQKMPSEAKIQMVSLEVFNKNALRKLQEKCESDSWNSWDATTLLRTHKVNGTRQPILVIAKARN
jgi:hypothetical protein